MSAIVPAAHWRCLAMSGGGKADANFVTIGEDSGSTGTAGIIDAPTVSGGSGSATVHFNHSVPTATPYYFIRDGTSGGTAVQLTGSLSMVNTALTGANTYAGGVRL